MPRKDNSTMPTSAQAQQDAVSEGIENLELPRSLVRDIAKCAVEDGTQLRKDTVTALVKSSTVFINYLAAVAHDVAQSKQHKSVSASDILKALEMIDFAFLVGPLQEELKIFREQQRTKKGPSTTAGGSTSASTPVIPKVKLGRPKRPPTEQPTSEMSTPLPGQSSTSSQQEENGNIADPRRAAGGVNDEDDEADDEEQDQGPDGDDDEGAAGEEDEDDEEDEEQNYGEDRDEDIEMSAAREAAVQPPSSDPVDYDEDDD